MKGGCSKREVLKFNLLTNLCFHAWSKRLSQLERVNHITASAQRLPLASRSFSSSTITQRHTSKIGKTPFKFQPSALFKNTPTLLSVTGPLGTTSVPLEPYMTISFPTPNTLALAVENVSGLVVLRLKLTDIVHRVFSLSSTCL
jgi:hypothetical protein